MKKFSLLILSAALLASCGGASSASKSSSVEPEPSSSSIAESSLPISVESSEESSEPVETSEESSESLESSEESSEPIESSEESSESLESSEDITEESIESSEESIESSEESEPVIAPITLTAVNMLNYNGSQIQYRDGSAIVNEIEFGYEEMGCYGNGMQMRHISKSKNNKSTHIWNIGELPGTLKGIDIVLNADKSTYDNTDAFKITVAEDPFYLSTIKNVKEYNLEVEGNKFEFEINIGYSFYIDSISLIF